jgi:hypothetical protein
VAETPISRPDIREPVIQQGDKQAGKLVAGDIEPLVLFDEPKQGGASPSLELLGILTIPTCANAMPDESGMGIR